MKLLLLLTLAAVTAVGQTTQAPSKAVVPAPVNCSKFDGATKKLCEAARDAIDVARQWKQFALVQVEENKRLYAELAAERAKPFTRSPDIVEWQDSRPCDLQHPENCIGGGAPQLQSGSSRVVKLSDEEYARLQKLRQAVVDAETEIAKGHGVVLSPVLTHKGTNTCLGMNVLTESWQSRCDTDIYQPADKFQFRGQFLLINVPKPTAPPGSK